MGGGEISPSGEYVPNPAGDDFYMYVNGEWFENLTNADETQGYSTVFGGMMAEKTAEATEYMKDYQMVIREGGCLHLCLHRR